MIITYGFGLETSTRIIAGIPKDRVLPDPLPAWNKKFSDGFPTMFGIAAA